MVVSNFFGFKSSYLYKNKTAFSLLEVSIVVSIISILLLSILGGRTLIGRVRSSAIHSDANTYITAFTNFWNAHQCLPGSCETNFILENAPSLNIPECDFSTANEFISWKKSACTFKMLAIMGFISSESVSIFTDDVKASSPGLAGISRPYIKGNSGLSWDITTLVTEFDFKSEKIDILPVEPNIASKLVNSRDLYLNRQALVIVPSSFDNYSLTGSSNPVKPMKNGSSGATFNGGSFAGGIDSILASNIDKKFDDSMPYLGDIISGRNGTNLTSGSSKNDGCVVISANLAYPITSSHLSPGNTYNTLPFPCITAYVMPSLIPKFGF